MKIFSSLLFFCLMSLCLVSMAVGTNKRNHGNSNRKVVSRVLQTRHQTDRNGPLASSIVATSSKRRGTQEVVSQRAKILSLLLPWLYFMAVSLNIPNMPKYVNYQLSATGSTDVTSRSAAVYGSISGVDAFFTFLSVNLIGVLSDIYGRRPFMMMSALGLGLAYTITMYATYPTFFYAAAAIDGLTSCMFSQAQSYVADLNTQDGGKENISVVLGRFQGLAVGMAFLFGIPLGAILGIKGSLMTPLRVSISICLINALLIWFCLPESSPLQKQQQSHKKVQWSNANPFGAMKMLRRDQHLVTGAAAYLFVNIAQAGVQINWINYLQYRFGWSAAKSGSTMLVVGLTVAVLPKILIRVFGSTVKAISFALALHGVAIVALGISNTPWQIYTAMTLFAAGGCSLPMILGHLTEQVLPEEVGALQGAADTVRTISTMIGSPLMSKVFAYFIGIKEPRPEAVFFVASGFSLVSYLLFLAGRMYSANTKRKQTINKEKKNT